MAMAYFKILSQHLSRRTEENYMKYLYISSYRESNMRHLDKKPFNYIAIFTIHWCYGIGNFITAVANAHN
jgi:hypothetical protein